MVFLKKNELISILMPVRNAMPFLVECIESIISQKYQNWELIAVNNGSTDSSLSYLEECAEKDSRIRVFNNTGIHKIVPGLEIAFENARGKYITRMDADDIMTDYKLSILRQILKDHGSGTVATGKVNYFSVGELGEGFIKYEKWLNEMITKNNHQEKIYQECVLPSPCWMMHAGDLKKIGGLTPEIMPEDYDLCFRVFRHQFKIIGSDQVLHLWRDHYSRNSRNDPDYADNSFLAIKIKYFLEASADNSKPIIVWGAGKKAKKAVKILMGYQRPIEWVCNNDKKIGCDVYGIIIRSFSTIEDWKKYQTLILVSNHQDRMEIEQFLDQKEAKRNQDYYHFLK